MLLLLLCDCGTSACGDAVLWARHWLARANKAAALCGYLLCLCESNSSDNINDTHTHTHNHQSSMIVSIDVGQIKSWLSSFRHNIASIEEIYGQFVTSVTNDQAKETADQLDDLIDETNALTHKVRGQCSAL
jgi:hypothetical protein